MAATSDRWSSPRGRPVARLHVSASAEGPADWPANAAAARMLPVAIDDRIAVQSQRGTHPRMHPVAIDHPRHEAQEDRVAGRLAPAWTADPHSGAIGNGA